jgi:hypothetical protein
MTCASGRILASWLRVVVLPVSCFQVLALRSRKAGSSGKGKTLGSLAAGARISESRTQGAAAKFISPGTSFGTVKVRLSANSLGSGLIQTQNAMMAARTMADKKLTASLS